MKSPITLILLFFLVFYTETCSGQSGQKEQLRKADSIISSYSDEKAPGMAVGIIREGEVIYRKTYGLANLEHRIAVTDSTAFDIASVSKQFTVFIILLAEKEGKLSLEDDIRIYLPELKHLPYKITIRQLANHTHGLPDFTMIKRLQGFGNEFRVTNKEAVQTVLAIKSIHFPPGTRYWYNNTGFMLLAEILHRIYKKEFNEILREHIFRPLQMDHSMAVDDPEKIIPDKAESYQDNGTVFSKAPLGQMEYGSSNIFTTLDDLCKWAVNFQNPKIGSREIYNTMQQNSVLTTGKKIEYGLGLQTGKYKGLNIVFHGGGTAGYRSYILHVPDYHLSIVMTGNRSTFDGLFIVYKLVDLFLKDQQVLPAPSQKVSYTSAGLKDFAEMYEINPGNYLEITTDGKNLYQGKNKTPLTMMGDGRFSIPYIPTASISFHTGSLIFNIGDFAFDCKKVILNTLRPGRKELEKFIGFYRNEEFNTVYQLRIEGDNLIARHSINPDIVLYSLSPSTFYSFRSMFGRLDFTYKNNAVEGFKLSGAGMTDIEFKKIK
ncbi:serine hydrolase domain-containing protein [Chryseobacterium flavum]|uniref:serine hydrolase domain-containing protein n=1 Tax=Chryseobacterium flavum TaxID=415851 RepID=UPI0028A8BFA0|nr:serine hydrolase domain-containing protein [Chryseobacterium flavum]